MEPMMSQIVDLVEEAMSS